MVSSSLIALMYKDNYGAIRHKPSRQITTSSRPTPNRELCPTMAVLTSKKRKRSLITTMSFSEPIGVPITTIQKSDPTANIRTSTSQVDIHYKHILLISVRKLSL